MKNLIQFKNDPPEGGGLKPDDDGFVPFDQIDNLGKFMEENAPKPTDDPADPADPAEPVEPTPADPAEPGEPAEPAPADPADPAEPAEPGDEGDEPAPLTLGDEPAEPGEPAPAPANTDSWKNIAKDLEISSELEADNFDSFKKAFVAERETIVAKAREEAMKEAEQLRIDKVVTEYGPDAAIYLNALKSGKSIQEVVNPVTGYEKVLEMDPETLMVAVYMTRGLEEEQATKKVGLLKDAEELDLEYKISRNDIVRAHEAKQKEIREGYANQVQAYRDRVVEMDQKAESSLKETILKTDSWQGRPVDQKTREEIVKRWESRYYRERFNDPTFVRDMIFASEFSAKIAAEAAKAAKGEAVSEAAAKKAAELHNLPARDGKVGTVVKPAKKRASDADGDDPFAGFKAIQDPNTKVEVGY